MLRIPPSVIFKSVVSIGPRISPLAIGESVGKIVPLATGESEEGDCSGDSVGLFDMGGLVYGGSVGGSVTVGDVVTIISTGARVVGETDGSIVGFGDGDFDGSPVGDFVGETVPSTMI